MSTADRTAIRPQILNVPLGMSLSDATAALVLGRCGDNPMQVSTATLLLPNNRAIKAMTEAFVRRARPGLLLPKMVAIGDLALDEIIGPLLDPLTGDADIPPSINPASRLILLARLVLSQRDPGQRIGPAEALRLARHLAELIDELEVERVSSSAFADIAIEADLQSHWQSSFGQLLRILPAYRRELSAQNLLGPAERRNLLLERLSDRLQQNPPAGLFMAAGITTSAPAVARVLSAVAGLPEGIILLPGVDLDMPLSQWDALGPHEKTADESRPRRSHETHPQFHLKLLLDRIGFGREEVTPLTATSVTALQRATTITDMFCLPEETANWGALPAKRKQLPGVDLLEASDSAEEARAIAIKIRMILERPAERIAVITPDRELALRITAQLQRWNITVDDSAGTPLLQTPSGTLILAIAEAFVSRFSPVALLAVAKHPLVRAGEGRLEWLDMTRKLDLELRGPATGVGLDAITQRLASARQPQPELVGWWREFRAVLTELDDGQDKLLTDIMGVIERLAGTLSGETVWKGTAGRQFATLWEEFTACDLSVVGRIDRAAIPAILTEMFGQAVVRPPYGGHPRVAIYGLLEARMQQADWVICGGLNEGTWPQISQIDPWLAPAIRRHLGLAALDRNVGLSAHDLATALGARHVLLTRAKRDRSGPTIASRFVLRIKALLGRQLGVEQEARALALRIDEPSERVDFASRPQPSPGAEQRKVALSITDFDQLKCDPYSFYAKRILGLEALDAVGAEPSHKWRGTLVHDVLEKWFIEDHCDPERLIERAEAMLSNPTLDPTLRALWQPRMAAGLQWIAAETARLQHEEGRQLLVAERSGGMELLGVRIKGRVDRIDRLADGGLAIIDYKTGQAPKAKQATAGFAMQLGLVGLLAEQGAIEGVQGTAQRFEYWSLAKEKGTFGHIGRPTSRKDSDVHVAADEFVGFIKAQAEQALLRWILGTEPFGAKLHPEYANYADYDQLMRLQEWNGRQPIGDGDGA